MSNNESKNNENPAIKGDVELTENECILDSNHENYTGKLLIVDPRTLLPEYRFSSSQLVFCTHGNGARESAIGKSVFCRELNSGDTVVYHRTEILGVADNEKLPKWAKDKLEKDCVSAIDKEICAAQYEEIPGSARYNLKKVVHRLNFDFGTERVKAVLAAIVLLNPHDGHFSAENKRWAASISNPPTDIVRFCQPNAHRIIINGILDKIREPELLNKERKTQDLQTRISSHKAMQTDTNKRKGGNTMPPKPISQQQNRNAHSIIDNLRNAETSSEGKVQMVSDGSGFQRPFHDNDANEKSLLNKLNQAKGFAAECDDEQPEQVDGHEPPKHSLGKEKA